jgi:hypothetical protein
VRMAVNGVGAVATGAALLVILAGKFTEGAWITVVVIPCALLLVKLIGRYYEAIDRRLRGDGPIDLRPQPPPLVVTVFERWDRLADKAVRYSLRLSPEVHAVHVTRLEGPDADEKPRQLRRQWREEVERPARAAGLAPPKLVLLPSPYRSFVGRTLRYVADLERREPDRPIAVVIPELVREHWWDYLLQSWRGLRLRRVLMRHGGPNLAVVIVPWAREPPHPEAVIKEEEPDVEPPRRRAATRSAAHEDHSNRL